MLLLFCSRSYFFPNFRRIKSEESIPILEKYSINRREARKREELQRFLEGKNPWDNLFSRERKLSGGPLFKKYEDFVSWTMRGGRLATEGCAWQLVARVRLCFHQLFIVRATKKGRSVRKGRSFRTWEGFEDDKRPLLPVPRLPGVLLSLSLSLSVLSAYSGTSFVVKLEGPQAVTYADTLRVIREPP